MSIIEISSLICVFLPVCLMNEIRFVCFHRLTHDIGLDEFEDADLSEITEIRDEFVLMSSCNSSEIEVRKYLA